MDCNGYVCGMEQKTAKTARKRGKSGDYPPLLQRSIAPYVQYALLWLPLKHRFSLSIPVLQTLFIIAYHNGTGVTPKRLATVLYNGNTNSAYRGMQFRLDTLLGKRLVERFDGRYRLTALAVEALNDLTVGGEGAKFLTEVERKIAADEKRRAKKLAKERGEL